MAEIFVVDARVEATATPATRLASGIEGGCANARIYRAHDL
jgi:hypothetical protein